MDKIQEFVAGVKFLAPGIVTAIIFYMYSDVKFDQFGFLLFCAAAIIFVSAFTGAFLTAITGLYCTARWAGRVLRSKYSNKRTSKVRKLHQRFYSDDIRNRLEAGRLIGQYSFAIVLGIILTTAYQNNLHYRILKPFVKSPQINQQDTLDFVLRKISGKESAFIDDRLTSNRPCPPAAKGCSRDVYLRIKTKHGDFYEGGMRFFPAKLELRGIFLSPACVTRIQDKLQYAPLEKIAGPGTYVPINDVAAIDFLDLATSPCFEKHNPATSP